MEINELDQKANPGAFSTLDMEIFVPEVEKLKKGDTYLEVGVDKGKSLSVARMVAGKGVNVCGVDLRVNPNVPDTSFWQEDSKSLSRRWGNPVGFGGILLLFIDGDHSYEGCKADIVGWFPHLKEHAVIMFHDCDESSPGVLQAVAEFVNTHTVEKFELFKRTDKNTSMAKVQL